MSMWMISPGCLRSYRRGGSAGSRALSLFSPRRFSTRLTVAGETPTVVAISLPGMRWRRRLAMRSTTSGGVGWRSRWGRELRSCNPARPSCWKRSAHLRPVRGQTPTASLAASGVCPLTIILASRSRPCGVRRAFLWMSIRLSQGTLTSRQHQLPRPEPDGQPTESSHLKHRLRKPLHLVLELGHRVGGDHQGAGVIDADLLETFHFFANEVGGADEVGDHLLGEIAAGIGERLAVMDQA